MTFVLMIPRKSMHYCALDNEIRIKFFEIYNSKSKNKTCHLSLTIGYKITDKLCIKPCDRVSFSYDDKNHLKWFIKKVKDNDYSSYKIRKRVPTAKSLFFQVTWKVEKLGHPPDELFKINIAPHKIVNGGILIDFDGDFV